VSKTDSSQIPNRLDLVIDFVNTLDREAGTDGLQTREQLAEWLASEGLLEPGGPLDARALGRARDLREALRALMLANNGTPAPGAPWEQIERIARRGSLGVHFAPNGDVSTAAGAAGADGALARLLEPIATAVADGTWKRVKVCPADECEWAFYDRSRNRSAVWCEMAVCGNRTKVRAYRGRAAGEQG
jgi:predicted RNA-binding Zn ribbon-like protein